MACLWTRDLPYLLEDVYRRRGVTAPSDSETMLIDVVEWLLRLPERVPRSVHLSDVLWNRILTPLEIAAMQWLQRSLQRGHALVGYLGDATRTIRNRGEAGSQRRKRHDLFFSDWGLHHLHLGPELLGAGSRTLRSRRILIAYLDRTNAYLIDVAAHGKGSPHVWGERRFLEILCAEWPQLMEKYELRGILAPPESEALPAADYCYLREHGVNPMISIDGKVYMGPGQGVAGDGSSTRAVMLANAIRDELDAMESMFRGKSSDDESILFVARDASIGFFAPRENTAYALLPARTSECQATWFFARLIEEGGLFVGAPEGAIWAPELKAA